jgi:multimeric flavodoxin WrbA
MNILTILGSPRRRGNTAAVLEQFEILAAGQHRIERVNIMDWKVNGCLGCDVCQRVLDEPGCRQPDDGLAVLRRILAADLVVYASPVYAWSITAQLKALFDRHYCLVKWSAGEKALMAGRQAILLLTCGGSAGENADLVQPMFVRQMACMQAKIVGQFVVDNCSTPAALGERAIITAREMFACLSVQTAA